MKAATSPKIHWDTVQLYTVEMSKFGGLCRTLRTACLLKQRANATGRLSLHTTTSMLSDSPTNKDTTAYEDFVTKEKKENWMPYGWSNTNKTEDAFYTHFWLFFTCVIFSGGTAFALVYQPDRKRQDWVLREAFLELERRTREGLPVINPNVVDPARITLPSDEELGDMEIKV